MPMPNGIASLRTVKQDGGQKIICISFGDQERYDMFSKCWVHETCVTVIVGRRFQGRRAVPKGELV